MNERKKARYKVITGFRKDQFFTVGQDEAHKAYWLFSHPEKRGIFSNGIAVIGADIREIIPDWHGMMGWNQGHQMGPDDWEEINRYDVKNMFYLEQEKAQIVARNLSDRPELIAKPLAEIQALQVDSGLHG